MISNQMSFYTANSDVQTCSFHSANSNVGTPEEGRLVQAVFNQFDPPPGGHVPRKIRARSDDGFDYVAAQGAAGRLIDDGPVRLSKSL